jgi:hypothetical protein
MKLALTFSDALHVHATESARVTIYIYIIEIGIYHLCKVFKSNQVAIIKRHSMVVLA